MRKARESGRARGRAQICKATRPLRNSTIFLCATKKPMRTRFACSHPAGSLRLSEIAAQFLGFEQSSYMVSSPFARHSTINDKVKVGSRIFGLFVKHHTSGLDELIARSVQIVKVAFSAFEDSWFPKRWSNLFCHRYCTAFTTCFQF